jgi:menaquinone-dependent protoporphyrinogen oxidase
MSDVPVFYAATDGHTRRIAERLVARFRRHGISSDALDIATDDAEQVIWPELRGAIVCASLRMWRHQRVAHDFVKARCEALSAVPSLFVSVSCSAASKDPGEREAARDIAARFVVDTGWTPWRLSCMGGALAYTRYNAFVRCFMRRIAAREGGPTATTRDHDLTDWAAVDRLADDLADQILAGRAPRLLQRHQRV